MTQWNDLNHRQQEYMRALFAVDQRQEQDEKERFNLGYASRKAEVWRWMDYITLDGHDQPLKAAIQAIGLNDEGTGSTFNALERRGLIECRYGFETREGTVVLCETPFLSVQLTRPGRSLVRTELGVKWSRLTVRQQKYMHALIRAEVAPAEEIEAAFRSREGKSKIEQWGRQLKEIQAAAARQARAEYAEYLQSLTRFEPCAYPGCTNTVKIITTSSAEEHPQPDRTITIEVETEGWHEVGFSRVQNTKKSVKHLYACCPEHKEGIFRLKVDIILSLDEQEERRIGVIQYPVDVSREAHWKVIELARNTAQDCVAQSEKDALLPARRKRISTLATQTVEALIGSEDPETFTDNNEKFKALYIENFVAGYREGLRIRKAIEEEGKIRYYQYDERWQRFYQKITEKAEEERQGKEMDIK